MICKQCNQENWTGATICAYCGASLPTENGTPSPSENPNDPTTWDSASGGSGYPSNDPDWEPTPTPKGNKKLWILIPSIIVSIALVAFVAFKFIVSRSPYQLLANSFSKSGEAFLLSVDNAENFNVLPELLTQYTKADSIAADVKIVMNDRDEIILSVARDRSENIFRADLGVNMKNDVLDLAIAANEKKLMLQSEQISEKIFTLPLETFGVEYNDSALADLLTTVLGSAQEVDSVLRKLSINLFAKVDFATFMRENEEAREFIMSLDLEKVDETILDTTDLTVYRADVSLNDIRALCNAYYETCLAQIIGEEAYAEIADLVDLSNILVTSVMGGGLMSDAMADRAMTFRFGINDDDCLSAFYCCETEKEENGFGIVLNGEADIWDEVLFYEGYEVVAGITITETGTGFVAELFEVYDGSPAPVFFIECNDAEGKLTISDEYEELFSIIYHVDKEIATFGLDFPEEEISLLITIEEGRSISLPKGEEASLLDLNSLAEIVSALDSLGVIAESIEP